VARRHEIGIRGALGAGKGRLVRQFLTESLLLAALGAVVALALAWAGTQVLANLDTDILPRANEIAVDGRVIALTAAVALLTVVLFGLAPAILMARTDINSALRAGGWGNSVGFRRNRLRSVLVIVEVALSLVLLSGAGLLTRSFYHLRNIDPGYDPRGVLTFSTDLPDAQYKSGEQVAAFYDRALQRIRALAGVSAAGIGQTFPLADNVIILGIVQIGKPAVPAGHRPLAAYNAVTPEYFSALRIPLKAGRYFTPQDNAAGERVAIVSEGTARQFYPNENPLGQRLAIGDAKPAEIVGIVGDIRDRQLDVKGRAAVYRPAAQDPNASMYFAVRTAQNPASLISSVRTVMRPLDPELPLNAVGTAGGLVDASLSQRRFAMLLMMVFAGLALALAMVGIYGVVSHAVTQAAQEIGIRMALGAGRADVLRMVLNYGGLLMAVGLLIGFPMALGAGKLLASQLFEVSPGDPAAYAIVSVALLATGFAACMLPAVRAMRLSPMAILRNE
jgi:putative ABC transport system permease protein